MNKTVLYVVAAIVGIGAAVALFGLAGPSPSSSGGDPVAQVDKGKKGKNPKAPKEGKRKELTERKAKPVESEGAKALASDFGQYCLNAAPAFTNLAMELNDSDPDLATEARTEASRLRKERRKPEADWKTILEEERQLLERAEAASPSESATGSIAKIRGLMEALEAAPPPEETVQEEGAE